MLSPYVVTAEVPLVDRSAWPIVLAGLPMAYAVFGGQSCHCYPQHAQGSSQRDVNACAPHALTSHRRVPPRPSLPGVGNEAGGAASWWFCLV